MSLLRQKHWVNLVNARWLLWVDVLHSDGVPLVRCIVPGKLGDIFGTKGLIMAAASISNYAKRMAHLSAKIFGELARPTDMKSMKVYRLFSEEPYNLKPGVVDYYPRHRELSFLTNRLRFHGLYRDEHEDFKDEMKRLRKLRGKGPPKKGEGKRAMKRK